MRHNLSHMIDPTTPCACSDCDWRGTAEELEPIEDLTDRIAPGETVPAGECPKCGALAHVTAAETKLTIVESPECYGLYNVFRGTSQINADAVPHAEARTIANRAIANDALNAACRAVQGHLGVTTGDVASAFWTGATGDSVLGAFETYARVERFYQEV